MAMAADCGCAGMQGLQAVEAGTNKVVLLASHAPAADAASPPEAIRYANSLVIAANGTIYFTDSQSFGPVLNKAGYFDTLDACLVGLLQVGSPPVTPEPFQLLLHVPPSNMQNSNSIQRQLCAL